MERQRKERNYSKSLIYKLCCNDLQVKDIYIGSTLSFKHRKNSHKSDCCNPKSVKYNLKVYKFIRDNGGFENWSMVLVEQYEATSQLHLEQRERYWLETLQATLNKNIPSRTAMEYRQDHIEHKNEKSKQHYEENNEKINEYKKKKFNCECGGKYTNSGKSLHEKSKKHITFCEIKNQKLISTDSIDGNHIQN